MLSHGLPPFLVKEIRLAFRSCARRQSLNRDRLLSSSSASYRRANTPTHAAQQSRSKNATKKPPPSSNPPISSSEQRNVVVRDDEKTRLSKEHRKDVPMKIIPQPKLTPTVPLSPQQRLHIEALTKRAPPTTTIKQVYKEKLLIYHMGTGREKFLILLKFATIFSAGFVLAIVAPAHYHAGTSPWLITLFVAGGLLPIGFVHALTKSWVTRIFLHLPLHARQTSKTAMDFARNLPASARLDIEYLRPVPLASKITANIVDLKPTHRRWKMTTFQWTGPRAETGTFWRPNLTQFYVKPESSKGKAARFTIPGIWSNIYRRLAGMDGDGVARWKR